MANNDKVPELAGNGSFDKFIGEGLTLVDFYAEWCMPCLMMAPVLDELAETFKGKIKFGKINVDDAGELAQKFQVSSIPNMILFKDGEIVEKFIGAQSADEFEEKLKKFL